MTDIDDRPTKKRRFFVEHSPEPEFHPQPAPERAAQLSNHRVQSDDRDAETFNGAQHAPAFDQELFETFVGEKLRDEDLGRLKSMAGEDTQRGTQ